MSHKLKLLTALMVTLFYFFQTPVFAASKKLEIKSPSKTTSWTLEQLKKKLKVQTFTVDDPTYKSQKTYHGFWLKDLLKLADIAQDSDDVLGLQCADGYTPTMKMSDTKNQKGLVAFEEVGASPNRGGWTPFAHGKSKITPAPFYLVWDTKNQEQYPWPYQLVKIEVIDFQTRYNRIFPRGIGPESSEFRGFNLFKSQCLRCHSLNLQGGDLGPELNFPKNITEYRDETYLKEFIRNSQSYRAKSKMPPFTGMTDSQFADLFSYLRWMKERKSTE